MIARLLLLAALLGGLPAGATEDVEKELLEIQKNAQDVIDGLNQRLNGPGGGPGQPAISLNQIDTARRKAMALATDEKFLKAANALWNDPRRNDLLIAQAIFFVVIFLLRAWRQAKAKNWFTRIIVGFFFTLILWAGLAYVLPRIVLGEPYQVFVSTIWRVITSP